MRTIDTVGTSLRDNRKKFHHTSMYQAFLTAWLKAKKFETQ